MEITTRPPLEDDREFVRDIHHLGYRDVVVAQFGSWDQAKQDDFFDKKWSNANLAILIVDGKPCGYATVEDYSNEVRLVELVIRPESQGRGIGTTFLHQLIDRASKRNVPVRLQVLLKNRAIDLYRRLGFVECDRTETHVLMERTEN